MGVPESLTAALALVADVLVAGVASGHVLLHKREPRAALGWIAFIWFAPFVGSFCYAWLGINRIERRASRRRQHVRSPADVPTDGLVSTSGADDLPPDHLAPLVRLVGEVTGSPLLPHNSVDVYVEGDDAYAAMLDAIDSAKRSIALCSYIFDVDPTGRRFVEALTGAVGRGVEVRVLVDDVGSRYSWERSPTVLAAAGVPVATFLPTLKPRWLLGTNLRNHRKLLVVDGTNGFTGGMNIREGHRSAAPVATRIRDVHFRLRGPVLQQMFDVFATDWSFTTGETLDGEPWEVDTSSAGRVPMRGIADGPDEDLDNVERVLHGALACARSSVAIVVPYFLPESALVGALVTTALRGVEVDIVLPGRNNQPHVRWASMPILPELVEAGCRVWESPPPFDHARFMVVDEVWSKIGSSNMDPRSLRLNFEFDVECYDTALAGRLLELARERIAASKRVTSEWLAARSLPVKLRDGLAGLARPYL